MKRTLLPVLAVSLLTTLLVAVLLDPLRETIDVSHDRMRVVLLIICIPGYVIAFRSDNELITNGFLLMNLALVSFSIASINPTTKNKPFTTIPPTTCATLILEPILPFLLLVCLPSKKEEEPRVTKMSSELKESLLYS